MQHGTRVVVSRSGEHGEVLVVRPEVGDVARGEGLLPGLPVVVGIAKLRVSAALGRDGLGLLVEAVTALLAHADGRHELQRGPPLCHDRGRRPRRDRHAQVVLALDLLDRLLEDDAARVAVGEADAAPLGLQDLVLPVHGREVGAEHVLRGRTVAQHEGLEPALGLDRGRDQDRAVLHLPFLLLGQPVADPVVAEAQLGEASPEAVKVREGVAAFAGRSELDPLVPGLDRNGGLRFDNRLDSRIRRRVGDGRRCDDRCLFDDRQVGGGTVGRRRRAADVVDLLLTLILGPLGRRRIDHRPPPEQDDERQQQSER